MKAIILAGGKGTRLAEYTSKIPKPMVKINGRPIITLIIDHYLKFGVSEILVAGGYKYNLLKTYFNKNKKKYANVKVINTGINTLTGKRIFKLKKHLKKETSFFMTYGDGVSDIDIKKLLNFHKKNKRKITLTAVHPPARFGELSLLNNIVTSFEEKPQLQKGWINGGYFVIEPEFLKFIGNKNVMLERSPLTKAVKTKSLAAYKHSGFWFCMDTVRDKKVLDAMIKNKKSPWLK